jgi:DivIVA domain-containing protein
VASWRVQGCDTREWGGEYEVALTPDDIVNHEFKQKLHGYAIGEVDDLLDRIADQIERTDRDVDELRTRLEEAVERYEESVLPALRDQLGYEGGYVLVTPEGKALALTFWESEEAADAGLASGFYDEQVRKFVTFFQAPPGRETYQVVVADYPVLT